MPTMEAWRQRGHKKEHNTGTLLFQHARQSSKMQSTHRNGAHRLKACELVVLSIAGHSALGALVSVSGGPEHASPPEVLMREIHLEACPGQVRGRTVQDTLDSAAIRWRAARIVTCLTRRHQSRTFAIGASTRRNMQCTVRTQYYLSTPICGQCARLPRPASHKPRSLLPHYEGAFVGEEDEHPVVGPRPAVPRPRGVCPCWQTRRNFLGRRTR